MNLQEFIKLLRSRWLIVCATVIVAVLGALAVSFMTTPLYQASTRLYVATATASSLTDLYQGNRLSQDRVLSYAKLLMGETVAQRTVDKLGLDMSAGQLSEHVKASATPDTVLIDVSVLDESPIRARDIANVLSDEFVSLAGELETPRTAPNLTRSSSSNSVHRSPANRWFQRLFATSHWALGWACYWESALQCFAICWTTP